VLEFWGVGVLEFWSIGVLEYWEGMPTIRSEICLYVKGPING